MTTRGALTARLFDVSVGGLGLRLAGSVSSGEFLRVRLQLPTASGLVWFDPDAFVARVHRDTVGVSLISPPKNLVQALSAHVSAHVQGPKVLSTPRSKPAKARPPAPPPTARVSRRELADLFRSALESVSEEEQRKGKKR